jgi:hypothetical protein
VAIQNINGKNAYVIQSEVPQAKTSSGVGYGSLHSQLRWKLWELAQESVKAEMGMEQKAYGAQLEYALKQKDLLKDQRDSLSKQINDLEKGTAKDQARVASKISDDKRRAEEKRRSEELSAAPVTSSRTGGTTTSSSGISGIKMIPNTEKVVVNGEVPEFIPAPADQQGERKPNEPDPITGETVRGYDTRPKSSTRAGGTTSTSTTTRTKTIPKVSGETDAAVDRAGDVVDYTDLIERLKLERADLETRLTSTGVLPSAPSFDLLERTRDKYQQSYGTGGMFGIAPRPGKTQPRFDETSAVRAAKEIADTAANDALTKYTMERQALDPEVVITPEEAQEVKRRGVLQALGTLGGREVTAQNFLRREGTGDQETSGLRERRMPEFLKSKERRDAEAKARAPVPYNESLEESSVEERIASTLPRIDRGDPRRKGYGSPSAQTAEELDDPFEMEGYTDPTVEAPRSADASIWDDIMNETLSSSGVPSNIPQGYNAPSTTAPAKEIQLEDYIDPAAPRIAPRIAPRGAPASAPGALQSPEPLPRMDLPAYMQGSPREPDAFIPVDRAGPADTLIMEDYVQTPGPTEMEALKVKLEELKAKKEKTAFDKKVIDDLQKRIGLDKIPSKVGPTSLERRDQYKLDLIKKATALAAQPKKFDRLAKQALPPEERKAKVPGYILLVDNLYDANDRAGKEPVKATFTELNRVFADDPKLREAAQEYLLAKDLLKNKEQNPEA